MDAGVVGAFIPIVAITLGIGIGALAIWSEHKRKLELIEGVVDAGIRRVEITSFVNPRWIPALADHAEVANRVRRRDDVAYSALVPNMRGLDAANRHGLMFGILGVIVAVMSCIHLYRLTRGLDAVRGDRDRSKWLPLIALPIGVEMGFSSAGAGALGTVALMSLTPLTTAQVVGTDVFFGLGLSLIGGGLHVTAGHAISPVLWKLLAGGVLGGWTGTYVASSVPTRPLRAALCVWLIVIGVQLCWKAF